MLANHLKTLLDLKVNLSKKLNLSMEKILEEIVAEQLSSHLTAPRPILSLSKGGELC